MSMRKAAEIKEDILRALSKNVDAKFLLHGFKRTSRSVVYGRSFKESVQCIAFYTEHNPRYAKNAEAHFVPSMCLKIESVSEIATTLVAGEIALLAGCPDIIINQPIDFAAPINSHERWLASGAEQIEQRANEIAEFTEAWVIPLFDELGTPIELINVCTRNDKRILKQHHWYVYIAAAYILLRQPLKAMNLLETKFGGKGLRRDFSVVFDSVGKALDA